MAEAVPYTGACLVQGVAGNVGDWPRSGAGPAPRRAGPGRAALPFAGQQGVKGKPRR